MENTTALKLLELIGSVLSVCDDMNDNMSFKSSYTVQQLRARKDDIDELKKVLMDDTANTKIDQDGAIRQIAKSKDKAIIGAQKPDCSMEDLQSLNGQMSDLMEQFFKRHSVNLTNSQLDEWWNASMAILEEHGKHPHYRSHN
jgi:hypothetical protein